MIAPKDSGKNIDRMKAGSKSHQRRKEDIGFDPITICSIRMLRKIMSVGTWEQEHKPCSPTPKNLQDRHAIIYPKEGEKYYRGVPYRA